MNQMAKLKAKDWTDNQKDRLAKSGYWLEYCDSENWEYPPGAVCIMNGYCKYIHWMWGTEWITLTWTCAPTKNTVANKDNEHWEYFATHQEMIEAHPELPERYFVKAPNDFEQ